VLSGQWAFRDGSYQQLLAQRSRRYRVLGFTLGGYGQSMPETADLGDRWYDVWADDMYQASRAWGLERFIYTGASYGAGVGWHLALRHPDVLRGFVSVVGAPKDRTVQRTPEEIARAVAARQSGPSPLHGIDYLKEVQRLGRGEMLPPLYLYDVQHARSPRAYRYGLDRTRDLQRRLEVIIGHDVTDAALRDAIGTLNLRRQAQRKLLELRRSGLLRGLETVELIGAGYFMESQPYTAALSEYITAVSSRGGGCEPGRRLLLAPAVPLYDSCVHRVVEGAGATVVAEDDWWGSRSVSNGDVPAAGDLLTSLFEHYYCDAQGPRVFPPELREAWFAEQLARAEFDAVVFYIPPGDLWFGWDYPRLRDMVKRAGVPSLLVRENARVPTGRTATLTAISTFLKALPE
jgi:pimeloyl-ACP methyl ester carboxylesterase